LLLPPPLTLLLLPPLPQNMRNWGNTRANYYFEHGMPKGMKPATPNTPDGELIRFMTAKYANREWARKGRYEPMDPPGHGGGGSSDEDEDEDDSSDDGKKKKKKKDKKEKKDKKKKKDKKEKKDKKKKKKDSSDEDDDSDASGPKTKVEDSDGNGNSDSDDDSDSGAPAAAAPAQQQVAQAAASLFDMSFSEPAAAARPTIAATNPAVSALVAGAAAQAGAGRQLQVEFAQPGPLGLELRRAADGAARVSEVTAGLAAHAGGVKAGDAVIGVNGARCEKFNDLLPKLAHPHRPLRVVFQRQSLPPSSPMTSFSM
jgi:hypothetical protein